MIRISVIVPTFNKAFLLARMLPSLLNQTLEPSLYEVLVIDNNSTDDTQEITYNLMQNARFRWRYICERRQGLHFARNRGILEAQGDIVVFGDEDIIVSGGWLENIMREFDRDPKIGIVGGPVFPIWDGKPPEWIFDYGTREIHPICGYVSYGDESKYLEHEYIFGCNFAIRKKLAVEIHGSAPDIFPNHMIHYSGSGECAMIERARSNGYKVFYCAQSSVQHHAPVARCTVDYFVNRYQRWAVENLYHQYNTGRSLIKILISLIIQSMRFLVLLTKNIIVNNKIDRKKFLTIKTKYLLFSWNHYFKLVLNRRLREYTKRTDYLKELEV